MLNLLQESQLKWVQRMQQNEQKDCKYSLHRYPLAFHDFFSYWLMCNLFVWEINCMYRIYIFSFMLQYWIYEALSEIGQKFGQRSYKTLQSSRMHKWKPNKILSKKIVKQWLILVLRRHIVQLELGPILFLLAPTK